MKDIFIIIITLTTSIITRIYLDNNNISEEIEKNQEGEFNKSTEIKPDNEVKTKIDNNYLSS